MDFKKSLKDVVVLLAICIVFGAALAGVNMITAPIIAEMEDAATAGAYKEVMPDATGFDLVDISAYELPASVEEVVREKSGQGYAVKVVTSGYGSGLTIVVGVSSDGKVIRAVCSASQETNKVEGTYGDNFKDKDMSGVTSVDLIAGSTLTTKAYRNAVVDAINAAAIVSGGSAAKTEEEIVVETLPAGEGNFVIPTIIGNDGNIYTNDDLTIKNLYKATNGAGYVCVVGDEYVAFDSEGNYLTEVSDGNKAIVDNVISIVTAAEFTEVDLADHTGISSLVTSVQKNSDGVYVIYVNGEGYGIKGDMDGYTHGNGEYIRICLTISADGKLVDSITLSHSETIDFIGNLLVDGNYNNKFAGKDKDEVKDVSIVAGATLSSTAYRMAVVNAFEAYTIIEGGT